MARQRHLSRIWMIALLALFTAGGCATGGGAKFQPVSETDIGRLSTGQMGPVDAARTRVAAAQDDGSRSRLRLEDAKHELDLAQAGQSAAKADTERATAMQNAAKSSNKPADKARAQEMSAQAQLHDRAASARVDYAQKLVAAREAEVTAADEQVKVRQAELDRAKLTALQRSGNPAAKKYDSARFDARVFTAQADFNQTQAKAVDAQRQAEEAHNSWVALNQQFEDRVRTAAAQPKGGAAAQGTGSAQTGTGAGQGTSGSAKTPPPSPPK